MPGDAAAGCLELILRFICGIMTPEVAEWLWWWMRASGACAVFILTFGKVDLMKRREILAGVIGIVVHCAVIALLIWAVVSGPDAA